MPPAPPLNEHLQLVSVVKGTQPIHIDITSASDCNHGVSDMK